MTSSQLRSALTALAVGLGGCGGSSAGDVPDSVSSATIGGTVAARPFDSAATALWIGKPDFAASTVLYLFEMPMTCSDMGAPGWDAAHGHTNQDLEMKLGLPTAGSTAAMTFTVRVHNPMGSVGPGEADVNHTFFAMSPQTPAETFATGGMVTLASKSPGKNATGTFHVTFSASESLEGTFDAAYCPDGVEP